MTSPGSHDLSFTVPMTWRNSTLTVSKGDIRATSDPGHGDHQFKEKVLAKPTSHRAECVSLGVAFPR